MPIEDVGIFEPALSVKENTFRPLQISAFGGDRAVTGIYMCFDRDNKEVGAEWEEHSISQ